MDFFSTMSIVFTMLLLFSVGFFLYKKKIITEQVERFLTLYALWIAIPALLVVSLIKNLSSALLDYRLAVYLIPAASIFISLLVAAILFRLGKLPQKTRGFVLTASAFSNTIIIGLPICHAIFGDAGMPFILLFYISNTLPFWLIAPLLISSDGPKPIKFRLSMLKSVLSPALIAFFLGIFFNVTKIQIPGFIFSAMDRFGATTTPICALLIGAILAKKGLKNIFKLPKAGFFALLGRLVISPVAVLLLCMAFSLPYEIAAVYVMQGAMPLMNQHVILAKHYDADSELASHALGTSVVLMLIIAPVFLGLCTLCFR